MRTNIRELVEIAKKSEDFDYLEDEEFEESLNYFFEESDATNALTFFKIAFDSKTGEITLPDNLNFDESIKIVNKYLEKVEELDPKDEDYPDEVNEYDNYTRDKRGADDGTFDYAGTYVLSILDLLQKHFKR